MTTRRAPYKLNDKKIQVGIRLRPSTIVLVEDVAKAHNVSKNMIIETGTITEAQRLKKESNESLDFGSR